MTLAVTLNGYNYNINSVVKSEKDQAKSGLTHLKDYLGTANGAYKCTDLPSKICKLGAETALLMKNPAVASSLKGIGSGFSKAAGGFIVPYCAFSAIQLEESIELIDKKGGSAGNVEALVKNSFSFVASACYSALLFGPNKILNSVATVADFGEAGIELKQEACKFSEVSDMEGAEGLTAEIKTKLAEKKKLHLFGLIKAVTSVVSGIFAVLALILATAVVPAIVSAVIGLVAITFTFIKHFYGENLDRKMTFERTTPIQLPSVLETA